MRKGNIIAGIVCAAVALYVIVTCLSYPRAEAYGTGVPGPGLWHRGASPHLLGRSDRRNPDDEKRRSPGASDVDTGNKACVHFHGDPAGLHVGVVHGWIHHPVCDHAVCVLPVVPQRGRLEKCGDLHRGDPCDLLCIQKFPERADRFRYVQHIGGLRYEFLS